MPPLTVRTISQDEHRAFVADRAGRGRTGGARRDISFLQTPAWGRVKSEWRSESLGWFDGAEIVGAGLVLYRQVPRLRRYLAYLPEGPAIDWQADDLGAWLAPMTAHLRSQKAFAIRMGPPVVLRRWDAAAVKAGISDEAVHRLDEVAPTERTTSGARVVAALRDAGWQQLEASGGFTAGQPQFNFQLPLVEAEEDGRHRARTEDELLAGMNQQWRRNIRKAAKEGVVAERVDPDVDRLRRFHELYVHTAGRDGFTPRPLSYFTTMVDALGAEDPDRIALFTADHEGDLVAATLLVQVGAHAWYSYGASSTEKREVRGSNAVQWAMVRHALARGAEVYDLRGITDTLDPEDAHVGLVQFKVGTGGEAVELAGEWDLPLNRLLHKAFLAYLARRR